MTRAMLALLLCGLGSILVAPAAEVQSDFPSRPIKIVVPFPPGGGIDVTARIAARAMTDVLGQQIVVQACGIDRQSHAPSGCGQASGRCRHRGRGIGPGRA
jgi:hypothetical protein